MPERMTILMSSKLKRRVQRQAERESLLPSEKIRNLLRDNIPDDDEDDEDQDGEDQDEDESDEEE